MRRPSSSLGSTVSRLDTVDVGEGQGRRLRLVDPGRFATRLRRSVDALLR